MYNPVQLQVDFEKIEHGKARVSAIRYAMQQADENHDVTYQLEFRLELCHESFFYGDALDMMIVFPEALALVDAHPDVPTTPEYSSVYKNGVDRLLEVYKWVIACCKAFYQIPLADCKKFFQDFKQRCNAFGYNLKPYYKQKYLFYEPIDKEYAEYCFDRFRDLPTDGNGDCKACDRNVEIDYYLKKGDLQKANELAVDIEDFTLTCRGRKTNEAWLRTKSHYLSYYLKEKDFENAGNYIRQIERKVSSTKCSEYNYWEEFMYCYAHIDIGKALKIYKEHWKEWQEERCPYTSLYNDIYISAFFRELARHRKGDTVKLDLDTTFSLYREDGNYKILELRKFYYNKARDIALKFDERNETDFYQRELERY